MPKESRELPYGSRTKGSHFYWGEISQSAMSLILNIAETKGYRAALDFAETFSSELATYALGDTRIDWIFHCYSQDHSHFALDLGSGWGGISFPLAKFFDNTVSLELVSGRLRFQQLRSKQDNENHIDLVAADMIRLPFRQNIFDLVAADGVLEWAALFRNGNPRSHQTFLLKEIRRCLKPEGCLFIGIENRFGLPFLFGAEDHTSLPCTSVLPRKVADLVVATLLKDQGWTKYYTLTYSARGYESILREAGFRQVEFYWAYPNYQFPNFSGRLEDNDSYLFLAQHYYRHPRGASFLNRLASSIGTWFPRRLLGELCRIVWPNFLIFAWKDSVPKRTQDAILEGLHAGSVISDSIEWSNETLLASASIGFKP